MVVGRYLVRMGIKTTEKIITASCTCAKKKSSPKVRKISSFFSKMTQNDDSNNENLDIQSSHSQEGVTVEQTIEKSICDTIDRNDEIGPSLHSCLGKEIFDNEDESKLFYRVYPFHRHLSDQKNYQLLYRLNLIYDSLLKKDKVVVHNNFCDGYIHFAEDGNCNKMCSDVVESRQFKDMILHSLNEHPDPNLPLEMLNYNQIINKYRNLKERLNDEKLKSLNASRRIDVACTRASLNDRFIEVLSSNHIPRLHILIQICQKKGYGLRSVIGRIEDAINGKYKPKKYGEVDWEKALLALRIGGPKLLNILHVLDGYPGLRST